MLNGRTKTKKGTSEYEQYRRFTFTGKERDPETGYSHFGARYYDSDLSGLFLSVDPMSDKYPSISPYAYCAWNPVRLVDPDGEDVEVVIDHDNKTVTIKASYYVEDQYKELVGKGLAIWNDLSGKYMCDFGNDDEMKGYLVQFDLNIAKDDEFISPSNWISFIDGFNDETQSGSTDRNNIQIKKDNDEIINTIAHEVGHSLGLMHHNDGLSGLMEEDGGRQSGNGGILKFDIQNIINKAVRRDNPENGSGVSSLRQIGNQHMSFRNNTNVSLRRKK